MTLPRLAPSRSLAALVVVCLMQVAAAAAWAQGDGGVPSFPPLTGRVVDAADILPQTVRDDLDAKLKALQDKTTTQLVVVTLPSLGGREIEDYGYRLGRAWGIGQKGSNNGALLVVAPNERKVRVEVGYGLEGTLTDAVSRLIIENAILPRFKAGDFAGGIERGTDDLVQVLSGDAEAFKARAAEQQRGEADGDDWVTFLVIAVILFVFFVQFMRGSSSPNRRGGSAPPIFFPGGGGRSGGFGGGGGGFSGGGGSFGGGGASGSW